MIISKQDHQSQILENIEIAKDGRKELDIRLSKGSSSSSNATPNNERKISGEPIIQSKNVTGTRGALLVLYRLNRWLESF